MRQRLEILQRLASMYAVVEEIHSAELHKATSALREAEQAIEDENDAAKSARIEGRAALAKNDHLRWMISETQQETAGWRRQRLEKIRLERERLHDEAKQQYVASRLRLEQMKHVCDEIAAQTRIEEERSTRAASDDRFLGRRSWAVAREKKHMDHGMKLF